MLDIFVIAFTALFIWIVWQLFCVVKEMAEDRGHNHWPWWIISLLWPPFAAMLILWLFFDKRDNGHSYRS